MAQFGEIYVHTNTHNGKSYVGQTTLGVDRRWKEHIHGAHQPKSPNHRGLFAKAIRKYGRDAFEQQVLSAASSQEALSNLEKVWIILLQTKAPSGYNLTDGGDNGALGHVVSAELRAKIAAIHRGNTYRRGAVLSAESKAKMSISAFLRPRCSAETRAKRVVIGQNQSAITRAKIAASVKRSWETRRKAA